MVMQALASWTRSPMSASPRSIAISARRRISTNSSTGCAPRSTEQSYLTLWHDIGCRSPLHAAALALAGRGLGNVWPNPAVGCVIVKDGERRRPRLDPAGRPAPCRDRGAARAGKAQGRDRLCHPGALQPSRPDAALRRRADRGGRVAGRGRDRRSRSARVRPGLQRLRDAGIAVETGLMADAAAALNAAISPASRPAGRW